MNAHDLEPDKPLTDEQLKLVAQLKNDDLKAIDKALLSNACGYWRKVARVVGTTMSELPNKIQGLPDVFYAQRILHLVSEGRLLSQGDLNRMRYSEVRLPGEEQECE